MGRPVHCEVRHSPLGTELSAGTPLGPTRWRVSAHDLGKAIAYSPKDFVGVMDLAIDLRSVDAGSWIARLCGLNGLRRRNSFRQPSPMRLSRPP